MDFSALINLQVEMFLLLIAGAVLRKMNILPGQSKDILTDLVLDLILPCNIINSFRREFSLETLTSFLLIIIVALAIQVMCYILSRILYRKEEPSKRKVFQYCTMASNAGFLGNPIAEGVFGAEGLALASIYLIPQRVVMWSAGLACFTETGSKKDVFKKVATHPCIVAVYIGMVLMVGQVPLPEVLGKTIQEVGACTMPLSMILIGTIFADVPLKGMVTLPVIRFTLIRLGLIPLLSLIGCRIFGVDPLVTAVSVLLAGMPAASTTAILANKYGGDVEFATKCVVFSTLMTLFTVPLWCMVL